MAILFFRSTPKNTTLAENVGFLLPVKFRQSPFCGFREEVENVSVNQIPVRPSCFPISPKNISLVEDVEFLLHFGKFRSVVSEK